MLTPSLLTVCIGLSCFISYYMEFDATHLESHVDYYEKAASSSVRILAKELRASRLRLQGFGEWLHLETDANTRNFLNMVEFSINPTLKAIKQNVDVAIREGKVTEQCYTVALQNIKQKAEQQLPAVVSCIETFTNSTDETLVDVADCLSNIKSFQKQLKSILPKCVGSDDKTYCIRFELKNVTFPILNFESYSRSTVENGHTKYFNQFNNAVTCLHPVFTELSRQVDVVLDKSNLCIQNAETGF